LQRDIEQEQKYKNLAEQNEKHIEELKKQFEDEKKEFISK